MYPHDIILDIGLYELCIVFGLIAAMILFRVLADKRGLSARLQNGVLVGIPFALFVGYPSAVVVQWVYNGIRDGKFADSIFASSTGSTFYGGLIGGSLAFLAFYFVYGRLRVKNREHLHHLPTILEIGPPCIAIGHALGRVGCFFAGCCFGIRTDSFLGVYLDNPDIPHKVLPVQLFEAAFLVVLCVYLVLRFYDGKRYALPHYLILYGIWRFSIEYLRGDDRGATFVSFLTPSQLTAIVLILLGIILTVVFRKTIYKPGGDAPAGEDRAFPPAGNHLSPDGESTEKSEAIEGGDAPAGEDHAFPPAGDHLSPDGESTEKSEAIEGGDAAASAEGTEVIVENAEEAPEGGDDT